MKYKIAIVDDDELYLSRVCKVFSERYADRLSVYSYSSFDSFNHGKGTNCFDLAIFSERMIKKEDLPTDVHVAFFVNENDIDKVNGIPAICKYQKHETLLKQIMDLCLEKETMHYTKKSVSGNATKMLYVTSAKGGAGCTTIAVAAAMHFAALGHKVMYLSLEQNSCTNLYFSSAEKVNLSDVIYLLKSKKNNLISRLGNIIQKDVTGVEFFNKARTAFDVSELTYDEISTLLTELRLMGEYDYFIVDSPFRYDETGRFLCEVADNILLISDGTVVGGEKTMNLQDAIHIWDSQNNAQIQSKIGLIYNRFDTKSGVQPNTLEFNIIGGTPKYSQATEKQIAQQISTTDFWNNIFK